jgi:hypothetical protein
MLKKFIKKKWLIGENSPNLVTLPPTNALPFGSGEALLHPGLPDGLFSNQKSQLGEISQGLVMESVSIFYDIWNFYGYLV